MRLMRDLMMKKNFERNFKEDLAFAEYKQVSYTIFNMIDDDMFVHEVNRAFNNKYSIDDFEYYDFGLSEKEKFLVQMHNSEFLKNVKVLKEELKEQMGVKIYVYHDDGIIRIVKLKNVSIL